MGKTPEEQFNDAIPNCWRFGDDLILPDHAVPVDHVADLMYAQEGASRRDVENALNQLILKGRIEVRNGCARVTGSPREVADLATFRGRKVADLATFGVPRKAVDDGETDR